MIIHLDSTHYLNPLSQSPIRLGASFTHIANVDFAGHVAPAYVKIDDPSFAYLFNEALGYLACKALDILTPTHAAILDIDPMQLSGIEGVPSWAYNSSVPLRAWATEDMGSESIAQLYRAGNDADELWRKVLATEHGKQIAAIDEFLANADRNSGNILHVSARRFAAIDHGCLLGGCSWPRLGINDVSESDVLKKARELLEQKPLKEFESSMAHRASKHNEGWQSIREVVRKLLRYAPESGSRDDVLSFLDGRVSPSWMTDRLGLI